jgi:polar amino acid transport system substrate-binding protein
MRDEIPQLIEEVLQGAERIKFIVSELRGYARPHSASKGSVALNEVVRSAVALIANTVNKKTSRFSVSYGKDLPEIRGNLRRLEQVVLNLILNACQALESRDKAVRVRTLQEPDAERVIVTVEDEGRGIPEADLGRILNPFYTTRREDGGTGLGLAVAARIVDEHQGQLSYESELGKGTLARLSLPVYREDEA